MKNQNPKNVSDANSSKLTSGYYLYLDTSEMKATISVYYASNSSRPETLAKMEWAAGRELSKTLSIKYGKILTEAKISDKDLSGICAFVGPGSFTGLRIGLSFANGLAFALSIPIYETKTRGELNLSEPKEMALPFYGAEPKITKPKSK